MGLVRLRVRARGPWADLGNGRGTKKLTWRCECSKGLRRIRGGFDYGDVHPQTNRQTAAAKKRSSDATRYPAAPRTTPIAARKYRLTSVSSRHSRRLEFDGPRIVSSGPAMSALFSSRILCPNLGLSSRAQRTDRRGNARFTANNASSSLVETPSLSKMLLR